MTVALIESMGSDMSIVNAARVSFHNQSKWEEWSVCRACHTTYTADYDGKRVHQQSCKEEDFEKEYHLSVKDKGLINFLMRNRHGTPFEMVQFKFRIRVPIGVSREWMRHRIGSFNEESTRYVEMRPDFYIPEAVNVRAQVGKPGEYTFAPVDQDVAEDVIRFMSGSYNRAYKAYKSMLELGIAKELARNVLPLGMLTEFVWSVNLRSLLNFLSLRTAPNALLEIRLEAHEVERLAATVAPASFEAWNNCGRIAP